MFLMSEVPLNQEDRRDFLPLGVFVAIYILFEFPLPGSLTSTFLAGLADMRGLPRAAAHKKQTPP